MLMLMRGGHPVLMLMRIQFALTLSLTLALTLPQVVGLLREKTLGDIHQDTELVERFAHQVR